MQGCCRETYWTTSFEYNNSKCRFQLRSFKTRFDNFMKLENYGYPNSKTQKH